MSYISILLPAFHLNTTDISEIIKQCSIQFDLSPDKFDVLEINDKSSKINFGIKFNESNLSLSSIEDLIYQKDCMQTLSEKAFESLHSMSQKLNELINSFKENGNNEEFKKDLMNDNIKLKELLVSQIEYSDNFRINTEKTLNRIKEEFRTIVKELETLKKKSNNKDDDINNIESLNNNINNNALLISSSIDGNLGNENKNNTGNNIENNIVNDMQQNINSNNTNNNSQINDNNNVVLPLKVNLIK
jgi:hypothetical protein